MAKHASINASAVAPDFLCVDIVWEPGSLGGAAQSVVDALRMINAVAALRDPAAAPPVQWRWLRSDGRPVAPSQMTQLSRREQAPAGAHAMRRRSGTARDGLADVLVVPGWLARNGPDVDQWVMSHAALLPRLARTLAQGGALLGVFTGVALLAAGGCLQGRRATAPWPFIPSVMRHAAHAASGKPHDIDWSDAEGWTRDGSVWTCASPAATTEAVLDLVGSTPLATLAQAARDVLLPTPLRQGVAAAHARSAGESLATSRVPTGLVERARQWMLEHVADPYDITVLARAAATSPRSLARHFGATHGISPHQYLEQLRVERARLMLQTSYLPIEEIGRAIGLPHVSTFRRVFLRHTGELPGEYRQRYRLRTPRPRWGSDPQPRALQVATDGEPGRTIRLATTPVPRRP